MHITVVSDVSVYKAVMFNAITEHESGVFLYVKTCSLRHPSDKRNVQVQQGNLKSKPSVSTE